MPTNISRIKGIVVTLVMLFVTGLSVQAQYPVQVQPQIISPPSLSLTDYYTGVTPKLIVTLTNRDLQQNTLRVRLRVTISSNTVLLTTDESKIYIPIELSPGVPTRLTLNDLEQYLNPNNLKFQGLSPQQYLSQGQLPEGLYSFCFDVVEVPTNRVVSQPGQCAMAWLSLTEPPLLNVPANNERVAEKASQFLVFNWTPRHQNSPNSATNTQYQFELVELLDEKVDPNAAFVSSRVLYKTTQTATTLIYGPGQPLLIPGKRYGWRVRLVPVDLNQDFDEFRNNGYSDIYSFYYTTDCPTPAFENTSLNRSIVNLSWKKCKDVETYQIKYRPKNLPNAIPKYSTVNGLQTSIGGLQPNTEYVFWITYICSDGSEMVGEQVSLNIPAKASSNTEVEKGDSVNPALNDILASKAIGVSGMVRWAFAGGQPSSQVNLVSTDASLNNKEELIAPTDLSAAKILPGADIKLFLKNEGERNLVEMVETDDQGNYAFSISKEEGTYELEVSHPTGFFNPIVQEITPVFNEKGYIVKVEPVMLLARSMEYSPAIYSTSLTETEIKNLKVDVLLEANAWNRSYSEIGGQMGYSGLTTLEHNNKSYNVITTIEHNGTAPALLQTTNVLGAYYLRIYGDGFGEQFLPAANVQEAVRLQTSLTFKQTPHSISGIASLSKKPIEQARIEVKVPISGIIGKATSGLARGEYQVYTTMTDETGAYHVDLPRLKEGVTVGVMLMNYSLSPAPFTGEVTVANKQALEYDFNLNSETFTYVGLLKDADGFPVENAQVQVDGSRSPVRTTRKGFFLIQGDYSMSSVIKITADGYKEYKSPASNFKLQNLNLGESNAASKWGKAVSATTSIAAYSKANSSPVTAGLLMQGKDQESLSVIYTQIRTTSDEQIAGLIDLNEVVLTPVPRAVDITIKVKGESEILDAEVELRRNGVAVARLQSEKGGSVRYIGTPGRYVIVARRLEDGSMFATTETNFDLLNNAREDQSVILEVEKGILANFKVISLKKEKALKGAKINVEGLDVNGESDKNGICDALIPMGSTTSVKVSFELEKYNSETKMLSMEELKAGNIEFKLEEIFSAPVTNLSGFAVETTSQVVDDPEKPNVVKISGKLTVPENDVFTPMDGEEELEFKNVLVELQDDDGNAFATQDIGFETATMQMKVYGGIPVEVEEVHLTNLEDEEDYEIGVIKGTRTKTVFGAASYARAHVQKILNGFPYDAFLLDSALDIDKMDKDDQFEPFEVDDPEGAPLSSLISIAVPEEVTINSLTDTKIFKLHFDVEETYSEDTIGIPLFGPLRLSIDRNKVIIDADAMKMEGFFQIPKGVSQMADSNGMMTMDVFNIQNNLYAIDIGFDISETKPFEMRLQKINTKITNIGIEGLGTTNCGVTLGGLVWLTQKKTTTPGQPRQRTPEGIDTAGMKDALKIISLSFVNKAEGVTLGGEFQLPEKGFSVKGLTFKTEGDAAIAFEFNFSEKTFELSASGILEYKAATQPNAPPDTAAKSKIFPIEIQLFSLKTADWSLFLAARPNKEIDFGVVVVKVDALIVNIGYEANFDQMAAMLQNGEVTEIPANLGGPDDLVEESKTDWAIGIRGGVGFPIKGLKVDVKASVLIGVVDDEFAFSISELDLGLENPAFTLEARVAMSFGGDKVGFEAEGKMLVMNAGLDVGFKYYKFKTGGFELGAKVTMHLGPSGLPAGPVTFLSIGGGFDFNTADEKYKVWLNGDVTNSGNTRETMYIAIAELSVLFQPGIECQKVGDVQMPPVIVEANGSLFMRKEEWVTVKLKVDFCAGYFLLDVKGMIPTMPNFAKVNANGTIFASAPSLDGRYPGCLFLCINATMDFEFVTGNIVFALGYQVDKNHPNMQTEVLTKWPLISDLVKENNGQRIHGFYVSASLDVPQKKGDYSVGVWKLRAGMSYDIGGTAKGEFYAKFSETNFGVIVNVDAHAYGSVTLGPLDLNGRATLHADLKGGYDKVWYMKGNANATLEIWSGNASCNDYSLSWGACWFGIPYPCNCSCCWPDCDMCSKEICPLPVLGGAKICKSMKASFDYREGQSTKIDVSF